MSALTKITLFELIEGLLHNDLNVDVNAFKKESFKYLNLHLRIKP